VNKYNNDLIKNSLRNSGNPAAANKYNESQNDAEKAKIEAAFVEIGEYIDDLGKVPNLRAVRRALPNLRNMVFDIYNLAVHRLDIREFTRADCGPTPVTRTGVCT
jgi:hypothetical protein